MSQIFFSASTMILSRRTLISSSLQKKLEKAVTDENFEQAALMRDEIKMAREKLADLTR